MIIRLGPIWVGFVLLAALATSAIAQETESPGKPDAITFRAEFGLGNELTPNRWNPVRVWVSSGSRSVQGVVELRYETDPTQEHRVVAPFTTTPGKIVPVDLLICPYEQTQAVTLRVIPDRGRGPRSVRFSIQMWSADGQMLLLRDSNAAVVLSVGDTGVRHATSTLRSRVALDPDLEEEILYPDEQSKILTSEQLWNNYAKVVPLRVGQEPVHWAAYDAARVVVIRSIDAELLAPGALEQIKLWTRSGGRLVLLVDAPGSSWQSWFDGDFRSPPVRLSPPEPLALSLDLTDIFHDMWADLPDDVAPAAAEMAPARRIQLTEIGLAHGWRLRWLDETDTHESPTGFLAEGPMGFGMVTVLGVDPGKTSDVLSSLATGLVWQDAIQESVSDWQSEATTMLGTNSMWGMPTSTSGVATSEVITKLVDFESAGGLAFVFIAFGILMLAIMLGPFDAIVLKRLRQRHRSWITAFIWITIFGGIAYMAPSIIRSGPAKIRQMQTIDSIQPISEASSPLTVTTELFGIFANRSGLATLTPSDATSLTSGVSAISGMFGRTQGVSGLFRTAQRLTERMDNALPAGSPLLQIRLNVWTFRTFLSRSPSVSADASIKANVVRVDDRWSIELEGIPPSARVTHVLLHTAGGFYNVEQRTSDEIMPDDKARDETMPDNNHGNDHALWKGIAASAGQLKPPDEWGASDGSTDQMLAWTPWTEPEFRPYSALAIAGPDRRGLSIQRRVESGRWGCVYVEVSDLPATLDIEGWSVEARRHGILRILVPLDDADVLEPSPSFARLTHD